MINTVHNSIKHRLPINNQSEILNTAVNYTINILIKYCTKHHITPSTNQQYCTILYITVNYTNSNQKPIKNTEHDHKLHIEQPINVYCTQQHTIPSSKQQPIKDTEHSIIWHHTPININQRNRTQQHVTPSTNQTELNTFCYIKLGYGKHDGKDCIYFVLARALLKIDVIQMS